MGVRHRVAIAGALVAALAAAYGFGFFDEITAERLRTTVESSGIWGPVVFLLLFALLEPFGVFGVVFVVPATLVWPLPLAIGLSWLGALGAGTVGFFFARTLAREWVQARLPARFRRFEARLEKHATVTVMLVRFAFFLAPPAHWALGLSRVRFAPFLVGSAIGFLPGILVLALAGRGIAAAVGKWQGWAWFGVFLGVLALVWIRTDRQRRMQNVSEPST